MKKTALLVVLGTAAILLTAFYIAYISGSSSKEKHYLTYYPSLLDYGGNETKILLLASTAKYDSYKQSFQNLAGSVNKGDPCFVISATIRNDYTEAKPQGYFVSLTALLYNKEGEVVGRVMSPPPLLGSLHGSYAEVNLGNGETAVFNIYVAYDKQDVGRYELYVLGIQDAPTP